jgi:hypothetical protein
VVPGCLWPRKHSIQTRQEGAFPLQQPQKQREGFRLPSCPLEGGTGAAGLSSEWVEGSSVCLGGILKSICPCFAALQHPWWAVVLPPTLRPTPPNFPNFLHSHFHQAHQFPTCRNLHQSGSQRHRNVCVTFMCVTRLSGFWQHWGLNSKFELRVPLSKYSTI